jgi:hypothetical protein
MVAEKDDVKVTEVFDRRSMDVLERRVSFKDIVEAKSVAKPSPLIAISTREEELEQVEEGEKQEVEKEEVEKKGEAR